MVGHLPDAARAGRLGFVREGDAIALVGRFEPSRVGSEVAKLRGEAVAGALPPVDRQAVRDAHEDVRKLVRSRALHNAHDIAEGGLAVALAECCIAGGIGARVEAAVDLFGEAPGRAFVVSGPEEALAGLRIIGRVGGEELEIVGRLTVGVEQLRSVWSHGLTTFV
jgi:phosphoribosylformylglycinamidine synthase